MRIKDLIASKDIVGIRNLVNETPIADIVQILEKLSKNEKVFFFRVLDADLQGRLFSNLDPIIQQELISSFTEGQLQDVVSELYTADVADLIEEMPNDISRRILSKTDPRTRTQINQILNYDNEEVGSIMYVDIIILQSTLTTKRAINLIRKQYDDARITHNFFVVNKESKFIGAINSEDLIFHKDTTILGEIVKPSPTLFVKTLKEEAAQKFAKYDMDSLPVIGTDNTIVGLVTADDMIDVIQEIATSDVEKMAGITNFENAPHSEYLKSSIFTIFRSRIFWLFLLLISATLTQIVLDSFQNISNSILTDSAIWTTAIVAIIPVISSTSGNAGSQVSTTIIRGLSLGHIRVKDYWKIMLKELKISLLIGLVLGVSNFVRLIIYYAAKGSLSDGDQAINYIFLSLAASISLILVIVIAKFFGGMLPLFAKFIKIDPAVMAAPILTTIIDIISTLIFFSISIGIMYIVL